MLRSNAFQLAGCALALLLAGCSSNQGPWPQYLKLLRQGLNNGFSAQYVTLEQAAKIPYASLGYRLNSGNEALLVLATDTNGTQLWTAASRVVLQTRDGRVVRSVGLPRDIGALASRSSMSLPAPGDARKAPFQSSRRMDFPDIGIYDVQVTCQSRVRGQQMIRVLGTAMSTVQVDESCRSITPRWSFTDSFWLDRETGFVWQSLQHIHPAGARIELKIFRPPE